MKTLPLEANLIPFIPRADLTSTARSLKNILNQITSKNLTVIDRDHSLFFKLFDPKN